MAKRVVDEASLKRVADSIRNKGKTNVELIFPDGFENAVNNIRKEKEEQEKTVTADTNGTVEVVPDEGKVLSKATVKVSIDEESEVNRILNAFGSGELEHKKLVYTAENFRGYMSFAVSSFEEVHVTKAKDIPQSCFENNWYLRKVQLDCVERIMSDVFSGCERLETVIINSDSVPLLENIGAFVGTPIEIYSGAIYVPASLVSAYQNDTNWSCFDILPLESLEGDA